MTSSLEIVTKPEGDGLSIRTSSRSLLQRWHLAIGVLRDLVEEMEKVDEDEMPIAERNIHGALVDDLSCVSEDLEHLWEWLEARDEPLKHLEVQRD